jgi:hypothetical protein
VSSAGVGGIVIDSGSGGSSGSGVHGDACAASSYQGERVPLDMYIMFDQSGSMAINGAWNPVRDAIFTFVDSPESAGIGVGIGYFPLLIPCPSGLPTCATEPLVTCCQCQGAVCLASDCNANDYINPDVAIEPLPGVAQAIKGSLNAHFPDGGTPTHPALQGAMRYALQHAVANPGRKTIVVLATDGMPNHCNSNVANVSSVAAAGYVNNPSLLTFVIGIDLAAGNLDAITQAGGTGRALIVNAATAGQDFLNAMNQIRGQTLACTFQVPAPPAGATFDPQQVNVTFTPNGGSQQLVYGVTDASQCDPALGGWYYDNPLNPTEIRTCPATCDRLKVEPGQVDIELGCKTEVIPT